LLYVVLTKGIVLAALAFGVNAAAAEDFRPALGDGAVEPFGVKPKPPFDLSGVPAGPLLTVLNSRYGAAVVLEPFVGLARSDIDGPPSPIVALTGLLDGPSAEAPSRPPLPKRSESPPPEPVPTAIAAALARLIVHDGPVNPLGDGDWRAARAAIGAFYAERGFRPVWVAETGLTPAGRAALAQLQRAPEDGLNVSALGVPRQIAAGLSPHDLALAETTIAAAVVAYAEQAGGSRVAPWRVSRLVTAEPNVVDPGVALAETASAPDPGARLADFNPPQKGYRGLRDALKRPAEVPPSREARPGRAAINLNLDASAYEPLADIEVDADADPQLDRPQRRKKDAASGQSYAAVVDRPSSVSARERLAVLANMEMWRWRPRDMGERRVEVNVPDYSVEVLDGDAVVHRARVVVGKPETPTPIFSNVMRYVLINPSWQVPDSIIKKEMMSRLGYLSHHGYQVKTVDGRLTVRQLPGEGNALGRLAFMFPNDYSVYLHDTPSQELFDADRRAFSHGCVRVEDPIRLAELVLGWPEERINAAIGGPEKTIFLPRPVPIHIEYFTEFIDDFGGLQQRPDVYGLTRKVAETLTAERQD
jgi:murein L,D-transpeptidase YcbB/YkuD